ncbi:hypothetical protein [Gordonia paraffinivorans]|uniref:hypothetical protein n=1 Tax=Gordonia paraffinivorans TaxID=175628 RepID=UPI001445EA76|nr:hypothetical protein [Gordonia paraffinivorans]
MTDPDDGVIRLVPAGDINVGFFNANTSVGVIETPILVWTDQRFGECHLMLDPVDGQAGKLAGRLIVYLSRLVEQEMRDAEEDGEK